MSVTVGPSSFWMRTKEATDFYAVRCPVGTKLGDGSHIFCKTGGRAWIVAPSGTEVCSTWSTNYTTTDAPPVGVSELCCISEWGALRTSLINNGFNPCDWFVPNLSQLQSGYNCRCNWDTFVSGHYWSSIEVNSSQGCSLLFSIGLTGCPGTKTLNCYTRAFRCVTY